ncbi:hypothetical protein M0804_007990 [Polistes exclamans]|nr:hypothetical protein M0804_007990 [Polistes exclamans]
MLAKATSENVYAYVNPNARGASSTMLLLLRSPCFIGQTIGYILIALLHKNDNDNDDDNYDENDDDDDDDDDDGDGDDDDDGKDMRKKL